MKESRRETGEGGERLREGAELDLTVERILPGGLGLAHARGQTVFVALSAPGDRVRARVESVRSRVAFASVVKVVEPSRERVEPPCPYFGRCGGCDFQQLSYEAQLAAKVEIIRDCLRRVARVEPPNEIHITPSPAAWHYRSRARWQHDRIRNLLGYHERGTHRVVDVAECPVAAPEVEERLKRLRALMREGRLPEGAQEFEAVAGDDGVALDPPVEAEDAREQSRTIHGERYRFDARCFFQINHALLDPLVAEALREAASGETANDEAASVDTVGATALDLYSGVGLFTLPLARRFSHVVAVEGNPAASEYARRNIADAGLSNATVETAAVGDWLARNSQRLGGFDFILLDPPRAGAEPETVRGIIRLCPRRISYVSCDPATLARDLRVLCEAGYKIASVRAFDMFPQTHHVETVVRLSRQ
ncbi:MAG TPA: class I SAM-dependent RNA methyltransferase, partial [Pyrinomonadaceae bacterium]|nr:class I SAM-dependent RNA methyltransferase [Pyrinomonadaceae bacterium]